MIFVIGLLLALSDPLDAYDAKGEDIIPAAFQGNWAPNKAGCKDEDGVNSLIINASTVTAYDFRAKLLKHAGANLTPTTNGKYADSIVLLVAQSGEGDVDITRYRLAVFGGKLYLDYPDKAKGPLNPKVGSHIRCVPTAK